MKKYSWVIVAGVIVIAIAAGASVYFWNSTSEKQIVNSEQDVPKENNSETDIADWQTYESQKLGISFQYPKDWVVINLSDSKAGVALRSPYYQSLRSGQIEYAGEIYINTLSNPNNLSPQELLKTFSDGSNFWPEKYEFSEINLNNMSGIEFPLITEGTYHRSEIMLNAQGKTITGSYLFPESKGSLQNVFKAIMETVTVASEQPNTVAVNISDWQTYQNKELGFEFKYPQEWVVEADGKIVWVRSGAINQAITDPQSQYTGRVANFSVRVFNTLAELTGDDSITSLEEFITLSDGKLVSLNGVKGFQVFGGGDVGVSDIGIYIERNNNIYFINNMDAGVFNKRVETEKILSTFKFTN